MKAIAPYKNMEIFQFGSHAITHQTLHTTTQQQSCVQGKGGRCHKNQVRIQVIKSHY